MIKLRWVFKTTFFSAKLDATIPENGTMLKNGKI